MSLKCIIFNEYEDYNERMQKIIRDPSSQFNNWITEDIKVHSIQPLADKFGRCKSILVSYEQQEEQEAEATIIPCCNCKFCIGKVHDSRSLEWKGRCVVDGYSMEKLVPYYGCDRGEFVE